MSYYHLYHMDPDNDRIDWFEEIDAINHRAATLQARARQTTEPVELWLDGCKVLRLEEPAYGEPWAMPISA